MTLPEYATVLLKGLGAALLTHVCASVCRESGKNPLADWVEFAGKIEILLLCVPLFAELIKIAAELMSAS